jgi:hypothetical protein
VNTRIQDSLFPNTPIQIKVEEGPQGREYHFFVEGDWDSKESLSCMLRVDREKLTEKFTPKKERELAKYLASPDAPSILHTILGGLDSALTQYLTLTLITKRITELAKINKDIWASPVLRINPKWAGWAVVNG